MLRDLSTVAQAEKSIVGWLEERYGRGSAAVEKTATSGLRKPVASRLSQITPEMVAQGLYSRDCSVVLNEYFILESEERDLGEFDVSLLEEVSGLFREELPALFEREGRDPLTGLPGPTVFPEELVRLLASRSSLCLVLFDVDGFGEYNAAFGPAEGDRMLVEIAEVLAQTTRPTDFVFRQHGDEFALLLPNTAVEVGCGIAERVREALEARFAGDNLPLTASFGVASWPERCGDRAELLKAAKGALHAAWQRGGNRVCLGGAEPLPTS